MGSVFKELKDSLGELRPGPIIKELKGSMKDLRPGPIISELKGSMKDLRPGPIISELKGSMGDLRPGPIISELKGSMGGMSPGSVIKGVPGYLRKVPQAPKSLSGKLPPGYGRKIAILLLIGIALIGIGGFLIPTAKPDVALPGDAIFHLGSYPITNTLLASWLTIVVLLGLFYAGTRKMRLVPKGIQNVVEMVNEMLLNFCEEVAGEENGRRFYPVVATIFLYVIMNAFLCLIPGFSVIGYGEYGSSGGSNLFNVSYTGFIVHEPLLRKATTDINIPLMLALMSFIFVEYWGISSLGFRHYVSRFIRIGGLRTSLGQLFRGKVRTALSGLFVAIIDVFIGFIELVSEFVRIISFTFRLFGNMTGGEVLLLMMMFLIPWLIAVPFYGLEMLLGFVQALIFGGLTLVFATLAVKSHGAEE